MGLLETLVVGAYLYATAFGGFLYRLIDRLRRELLLNHVAHLEHRLRRLEARVFPEDFPPDPRETPR